MFRYSLAVIAGLCFAGLSPAASWADGMFQELSKDFGSVPRGPLQSHPFHLTNNTKYVVHIASVRVSCGCTSATALTDTLAPGQSTAVVAQMDTNRFFGPKAVTIFVQFDRPAWEEVRLWVQANSRDDVSITPDSLAFGAVRRGASPKTSVTVSLLGDSNWRITSARCESNYVSAALSAPRQTDNGVEFQVTAQVRPDIPVGRWYTDIWLDTNNPATPKLRVPLTVEIQAPLSLIPGGVAFGQIKAGGQAERKVMVRGVEAFRIKAVRGTDKLVHVQDSNPASRSVHVLTVTVKSPEPGAFNRPIDINRTLRVITDLPDENEIDFKAKAQIRP